MLHHVAQRSAGLARSLGLVTLVLGAAGCGGGSRNAVLPPEVASDPINRSIMACGEAIYVGAPVVLWTDERGFDATSTDLHFDPPGRGVETPPPGKLRYRPGRHEKGADGAEVTTIEGMAAEDGILSTVQQAFQDHHGLQYGFCRNLNLTALAEEV